MYQSEAETGGVTGNARHPACPAALVRGDVTLSDCGWSIVNTNHFRHDRVVTRLRSTRMQSAGKKREASFCTLITRTGFAQAEEVYRKVTNLSRKFSSAAHCRPFGVRRLVAAFQEWGQLSKVEKRCRVSALQKGATCLLSCRFLVKTDSSNRKKLVLGCIFDQSASDQFP